MKKPLFPALLASVISLPAFATDNYTIDPTHTFPSFEVSHLGFSTQRGRFNDTKGEISLDLDSKKGSVEVTIEVASLDTGLAKLEDHLRGEDFFDAQQFPTISFKSNKLKFTGDKLTSVEGNFTLHGVTKPMILTVDRFKCGVHPMTKRDVCGADASTVIKRSDFGMTKYVPAVSDEVKILIQVEAVKAVEPPKD